MQQIKFINIMMALLGFTLYGCSNASSPVMMDRSASYEITLTNLTANQPLAPVAIVMHTSGYALAELGATASTGLEMLAEGGDNAQLLSDAAMSASVLASKSGAGLLLPGASETVSVSVSDYSGLSLSMAGMLVHTNDAFAALDALDISGMAVGSSQTTLLPVFDAGTESNIETAATIPGQGGTGFDVVRDDIGLITVHRGVVTAADGLVSSALNDSHRFDNPAVRVQIRRIS